MSKSKPASTPVDLHPYLSEIAERLHSGHAAVMIGSGFSKNAKPRGHTLSAFPDWTQLGDTFYKTLNRNKPEARTRYLSVPTLAHEVEAAIGRPALDQQIIKAIPDLDYEPSPLHASLLRLPWTDVFTTNYDTLLERACHSVTSQRYQIVVNQNDLVYSQRPRIIKLHGSLPSQKPFILTDEDYRRYPTDFAALVNTVRQALIEDTLCLIGFSSTDPNFLQWIGWIHDSLGRHNSPTMYLIGASGLTDPQARLLARRNIISIDLSKCFDVQNGDYYRALEHFINYLESKEPEYRPLNWETGVTMPDDDLLYDERHIAELIKNWGNHRRSYPGWAIVPEDLRDRLWTDTASWTRYPSTGNYLSGLMDLKFAYEIIWRMEKCLCPIFDNQLLALEELIDRFRPDSTSSSSHQRSTDNGTTDRNRQVERISTVNMWHHISLSLLRHYREEGELEKWNTLADELQSHVPILSATDCAHFHYERCLSALFRLNMEDIGGEIQNWPVDSSMPLWEAKRAGLLAEIGQISTAIEILETSLSTIRSRSNLTPITTDCSMPSEEGITMLLLHSVQMENQLQSGDFTNLAQVPDDFKRRWHQLREYGCDPRDELRRFRHSVDGLPMDDVRVVEKASFDIHKRIRRQNWSGSSNSLHATRFLRFSEDSGIPFRIHQVSITTHIASRTLRHVSRSSPYWAMATLVRIGDQRVVDEIFDRPSLAGMNIESLDQLIFRYLRSLELARVQRHIHERGGHSNFGTRLARVVPEILSRLSCKCSDSAKDRLFEFLVRVYESKSRRVYRGIRNLATRLLASYSPSQRYRLIPRLLDISLRPNRQPLEIREFPNPLALLEIEQDVITGDVSVDQSKIDTLLENANSTESDVRKWALNSLAILYKVEMLSPIHSAKFAKALWGQIRSESAFPQDTEFPRSEFLNLPYPTNVDPKKLFTDYILRIKIFDQNDRNYISFPTGVPTLCREIIGSTSNIRWSRNEAVVLLESILAWWDFHKKYLTETYQDGGFTSILDQLQYEVSLLVDTMSVFMISMSVLPDDDGVVKRLDRFINELSDIGIDALRVEAACLDIFPHRMESVLNQIEENIDSRSEDTVVDSLEAIRVISMKYIQGDGDHARESLVRVVQSAAEIVRWRRDIGLISAMNVIGYIAVKHHWAFTGDVSRSVLKGLSYLIDETANGRLGEASRDPDVDRLAESKRLRQRCASARFAYMLSKLYAKRGGAVPAVIREWESICRSAEEFSDVRNQWIESDTNG